MFQVACHFFHDLSDHLPDHKSSTRTTLTTRVLVISPGRTMIISVVGKNDQIEDTVLVEDKITSFLTWMEDSRPGNSTLGQTFAQNVPFSSNMLRSFPQNPTLRKNEPISMNVKPVISYVVFFIRVWVRQPGRGASTNASAGAHVRHLAASESSPEMTMWLQLQFEPSDGGLATGRGPPLKGHYSNNHKVLLTTYCEKRIERYIS